MRLRVTAILAVFILAAGGAAPTPPQDAAMPSGTAVAGPVDGVRFVVAWMQDADPVKAAQGAYDLGVAAMRTQPKAIVFFESFSEEGAAAALKALRTRAGSIPSVGTKAPALVNGGAMQTNTMALLLVGGARANVQIARAELNNDRERTGTQLANALRGVSELKVVIALSEPKLSFEDGVTVEGFLRGVLDTLGKDVSLWGGNGRGLRGLAGVQYYNDEILTNHVVALGLGGPISVVYSTSTEFQPVGEPVTVTKVADFDPKIVLEFDGRPAPEVYRERRGMPADEKFTRDAEHPIGVITRPGSVYVRQVLGAYPLQSEMVERAIASDPYYGKLDDSVRGLRFVAPVPVGTKAYVLKGGQSATRIYESANQCVSEMLAAVPEGKKPMLGLISSCITRNSRINRFTNATGDEVYGGILPAMGTSPFPLLGFYAWGEIGHINGEYKGLPYQYQQHSFVPILIVQ